MNNLSLTLKGSIPTVTVGSKWTAARDVLVLSLADTPAPTDRASLDLAKIALQRAKRMIDDVEEARKEVKGPLLETTRKIDGLAAAAVEPLEAVYVKLKRSVDAFVLEQERMRREAEAIRQSELARIERERAEALAEAQKRLEKESSRARSADTRNAAVDRARASMVEAQTIAQEETSNVALPPPALKLDGLTIGTKWVADVIDLPTLYRARPELVKLEANVRGINAALSAGMRSCPGLLIREEAKVGVRL